MKGTQLIDGLEFKECNIEVFMGGQFKIDGRNIHTLGHVKALLREIIKELDGWGDDSAKCSVYNDKHGLAVDLEDGIHNP